MFKILYHPSVGEALDESQLKAAGFDGVELDQDQSCSITPVGVRYSSLPEAIASLKTGKYAYVSCRPEGEWDEVVLTINSQLNNTSGNLLIEPWNLRRTVRELWQLCESFTVQNTRLAISTEWSREYEQVAARIVPTLNHRIGTVSVKSDETELTLDFVRRLAGIGFSGYLVIGNTSRVDTIEQAKLLAESIRHLLAPPVKPKAAVAKAAVHKKPAEPAVNKPLAE